MLRSTLRHPWRLLMHAIRSSRARSARAPRVFAAFASVVALASCGSTLGGLPGFGGASSQFWGFAAPWDPESASSVAAHGDRLDAVVSGWVALDTLTGRPYVLFPDTAAGRAPRRLMLITSYVGERFHPEIVRALAADSGVLRAAAEEVGRLASTGGYAGVVIDWETHTAADLPAVQRVAAAFTDAVHRRGISPVAIAVPAADTAAYPTAPLLDAVDLVLVMLYDEHWASSRPGPIASPEWVRRNIGMRVAEAGADRIVAGFPLYGYHWRRNGTTDVVSFAEAQRVAFADGRALDREPSSETLRAVWADSSEVWVADAELLRTLVAEARRSGVRRFALWRMGQEDPAVWTRVVR